MALYSALNIFLFFETQPFDFGIGASVASTNNDKGFDDMLQLTFSWGIDFDDILGTFVDFDWGCDDDGQCYVSATFLGFNLRGTATRKSIVPVKKTGEEKK